jgi:glycosyltransferase involved in cell wall biosynthesis
VFDCQVGEWIASKLGLPHAVHLHYTIGPWLRAQPLQRLKSCDLLFCVSHFIAEQARSHGVNPDRIVVLHNTLGESELAAKPRVFTSVDPGSVTIGQVGRMAPGKGFSDTLSAFCQLRSRLPSVKLVLVGDGPERPQLEAFARKHELDSSSVRFTGWRSDIRALLSQMDVFVFPSRNEPFGMALLEACAAGVPAIAYREGGVPEIIVDQESGLLVPPGDLEALANAMLDLCQDPEKRERLSRGAQERARTAFSPRAAAAAFSAGLRRLAKEGSDNSIA